MAVGTGKKIVLAVIVVVGYLIGNHSNDSKKYEELKNKDPSSLSQDDKSFIKTIEDGRAKANSGVDNQNGKQVYYFTLDYSGINAFNVRGSHTIECYGTIGDPSHSVTYRTFN